MARTIGLKIAIAAVALRLIFSSSLVSADTRPFQMGFSTWPYDITNQAVDETYQNIKKDGDIVLEQLEEGIPWNESLSGDLFPPHYQALLDSKVQKLKGKRLIVAVNPLDNSRTKLALYRTNEISQPLPEPWSNYELDNPAVRTAFFNYCERIIKQFNPQFFIMGIEVNILMRDNPSKWNSYLRLHKAVYQRLKKLYPRLSILVSVEAVSLLPNFNSADPKLQQKALKQINHYTDILGISLHPFMNAYTTGPYPFDLFDKIKTFSKKPIAITETSFPAQQFLINIAGTDLVFAGSPQKQRNYFERLLGAAKEGSYPFVIVFSYRDYDPIWEKFGKTDQLLVWRDTGFIGEDGRARSVLRTWRKFLKIPYRR